MLIQVQTYLKYPKFLIDTGLLIKNLAAQVELVIIVSCKMLLSNEIFNATFTTMARNKASLSFLLLCRKSTRSSAS